MVPTNGIRQAACTALVVVSGVLMSASTAVGDELVMIEKAMYGPYGKPTFLVANSETEWNQLMGDLATAGGLILEPAPEPPQIDWVHDCAVLIAAGATGYDVGLQLIPLGNGIVSLEPVYSPLSGQDGGESLPYYLGRTEKHAWLKTQLKLDAAVAPALPLSGRDTSSPTGSLSWGAIKAAYR